MARSKSAAKVAVKNPTTSSKQTLEKSKKPSKKSAATVDIAQKLAESETVNAVAIEPPASQPQSQSPYQLDKAQTLKAARALLKHISTTATSPTKPNLLSDLSDPTDTAIPIYLILTTKSYLTAVPVLKPIPIRLPHALHPPTTTICLIVKDPQRFYKDLVATSSLSQTITKVISISKLKKKFKSFESQRQLRDSHDIFLADSRISTLLPSALGSTFYRKSAKIPATVELGGGHDTPEGIKRVVEKALQSTHVYLTPATHTTIRVALSSFTPEAVVENISTVVEEMLQKKKKIPGGFRSIKSIHIKSPTSASLPVYMAREVYGDEDVLKPEEEKERLLAVAKKAAERKEKKEIKEKNRKRKGLSETKPVEEVEGKPEEKEETPKKKAKVTTEEK